MLGENIRILRKEKGMSQETLAQRLNVVRQTVSKWEKGISVPDAEMLNTISELLEVPVSTLLGSTVEEKESSSEPTVNELAEQLAILNEQLALQSSRRKQTVRRVFIGILIAFVSFILIWIVCIFFFKIRVRNNATLSTKSIECTLDGNEYKYTVVYDENFRIYESGGDSFIANHIIPEQYTDANVLFAQIEDYFTEHGGTYRIVDEELQ